MRVPMILAYWNSARVDSPMYAHTLRNSATSDRVIFMRWTASRVRFSSSVYQSLLPSLKDGYTDTVNTQCPARERASFHTLNQASNREEPQRVMIIYLLQKLFVFGQS